MSRNFIRNGPTVDMRIAVFCVYAREHGTCQLSTNPSEMGGFRMVSVRPAVSPVSAYVTP